MAAGQRRFLGLHHPWSAEPGVLAVRSGPLDVGGSAMMVGVLLTPILLMLHPTQQFRNAPSFLEDPSQLPPLRRVPRP